MDCMIHRDSPFSIHIKNQLFPGSEKGQKETIVFHCHAYDDKTGRTKDFSLGYGHDIRDLFDQGFATRVNDGDHQYAMVRLNPDTFEFDYSGELFPMTFTYVDIIHENDTGFRMESKVKFANDMIVLNLLGIF